jgi:hypothetical protein
MENELSTIVMNYEKLQRDHSILNEQYLKCRAELEQTEKSDIAHKEQLIQSTDEANIYKRKLALLGNCFKTVVRKVNERIKILIKTSNDFRHRKRVNVGRVSHLDFMNNLPMLVMKRINFVYSMNVLIIQRKY